MRGSVVAAGSGQRRNPRQDERECPWMRCCGVRSGGCLRRDGTGVAVVSVWGRVAVCGMQGGIDADFVVAVFEGKSVLVSGGVDVVTGRRGRAFGHPAWARMWGVGAVGDHECCKAIPDCSGGGKEKNANREARVQDKKIRLHIDMRIIALKERRHSCRRGE